MKRRIRNTNPKCHEARSCSVVVDEQPKIKKKQPKIKKNLGNY